jgi:hypothetical protein
MWNSLRAYFRHTHTQSGEVPLSNSSRLNHGYVRITSSVKDMTIPKCGLTDNPTPWRRVFLQMVTVIQLIPTVMEPEVHYRVQKSLPLVPYTSPYESGTSHPISLRSILILFYSCFGLPRGVSPSGFLIKIL